MLKTHHGNISHTKEEEQGGRQKHGRALEEIRGVNVPKGKIKNAEERKRAGRVIRVVESRGNE